jgi:3-oxoacyl-[acyl-carrier-protein] synthase-1
VTEIEAIRRVFGEDHPPVSATKSMTGHALGAAGVHEAIYSILMMQGGYIAPSINVRDLDPALRPEEIVTETRAAELDTIVSNSFGFGGTNASLALSKYHG